MGVSVGIGRRTTWIAWTERLDHLKLVAAGTVAVVLLGVLLPGDGVAASDGSGVVGVATDASGVVGAATVSPRQERPQRSEPDERPGDKGPDAVGLGSSGATDPGTAESPSPTDRSEAPTTASASQRPTRPAVNLRPAALALAAARPGRIVRMNEKTVIKVARTLGMKKLSRPLDEADVERIARRAWKRARHEMVLGAVPYGPDGPDRGDFERAARRLGIKTKPTLHPIDVRKVLLAGRRQLAHRFDHGHVKYGRVVGIKNLKRGARWFDVKYGKNKKVYPADALKISRVVAKKGRKKWEARNRTPVFAKTGGVKLRMPSHRVRYAGFHQASAHVVKQMKRRGKADTRVMATRSRGTGRRTAIDVVLAPGVDVRAPVTGRVVEVTGYRLYGKYRDYRIRIVPSGNRRLLVTALHLKGPKVRVGDKIVAGKTEIAGSVRKFPFWSQVDGYSGRPWGHVHIETRRR